MILINEKAQKDLYLFKPEDSDVEFTFEPDGDDDDDGPV